MTRSARAELADDFYDTIKPRLHRRIGKELRLGRRILDAGCGSCGLVRFLADTYRQEVIGVDVSPGAFPSGRRSPSGARFRCLKRDAASLGFMQETSVDAVVMMWALHEMACPEAVLAEARRVLRPGGEILIVDFPRDSLAQRLWNEDYYRPREVQGLLRKTGFEQVQVRLIEQEQVIWARGYQPAVAATRSRKE